MDKIQCKICDKYFTRPLAHCWQKHNVSGIAYKLKFGLDLKRGITTEKDREHMRELVLKNGTVNNLKAGVKYRFVKGQFNNYKRSPQTIERLKKHFAKIRVATGRPATVEKIVINCATCGKAKVIYPRYYKENNNYCGITCRNIKNNQR